MAECYLVHSNHFGVEHHNVFKLDYSRLRDEADVWPNGGAREEK